MLSMINNKNISFFYGNNFSFAQTPVWGIVSGRYSFEKYSLKTHLFVSAVAQAHSLWVCWPVSVISGMNINFLMNPPVPLKDFGPMYRSLVSYTMNTPNITCQELTCKVYTLRLILTFVSFSNRFHLALFGSHYFQGEFSEFYYAHFAKIIVHR